ncbi:MAG: hypothetical protein U9O56_03305 [Campylobacterota bacterium]|nr:hypothetical protein [Campylobacterota bacterium]
MKKDQQKSINKVLFKYHNQISQAKANGYDGVIVPINCEYDLYCINNTDDIDYLCDIAMESGWNQFLIVDFIEEIEKYIDLLYEYEAA